MQLTVNQPCPTCSNPTSLKLKHNHLFCEQSSCIFSLAFLCPICHKDLDSAEKSTSQNESFLTCNHCKNKIFLQKIVDIIENHLVIDYAHRCPTCHSPTLHRHSMNLGHRCFFFPICTGQTSLFGVQQESLVFIDFETTGLDAANDHIIEIGALKIDEQGIESTYQTFINPGYPIPQKITQITGITDEMVQQGPSEEQGCQALEKFIANSKIVVHNSDFDILWLMIRNEKYRLNLSNHDVICTLKWAKEAKENRNGLVALAKKYSITHNNAHRALADAATTKELYFIFENSYPLVKPLQKVYDFSHTAAKMTQRASSGKFNYLQHLVADK